jgi:hypothetical protein
MALSSLPEQVQFENLKRHNAHIQVELEKHNLLRRPMVNMVSLFQPHFFLFNMRCCLLTVFLVLGHFAVLEPADVSAKSDGKLGEKVAILDGRDHQVHDVPERA